MPEINSRVGRVRLIGFLEGCSFLALVGIAMPLKYLKGMPEAVKWTGWVHGVLFIAYALLLLHAWIGKRISFGRSVLAFIAALLPFGPFVIDRKLEEDERKEVASR